jgi:UDP-N-acetylmuramoylalanine--D-glutamate ligase
MMRAPAFLGKRVLVLGLGDTGLSVARWVQLQGGTPRVADTRNVPPNADRYTGELLTGPFSSDLLRGVDLVCVSPGLSLREPLIAEAVRAKIPVVGDVELFAWQNKTTVLGVTGTNGKTTVAALTGHLLRSAGIDCEVAGNIGPAVLDALMKRSGPPAVWVLELSSYQLETTSTLKCAAAAVLNVTEDHLDRYAGLDDYAAAKARIFGGQAVQVLNRDDPRVLAMTLPRRRHVSFGLDQPTSRADFGIRDGKLVRGSDPILELSQLPIHGSHNAANALAACALALEAGVSLETLASGLKTFKGLPHRLELVAKRRGVEWYDDSKGTNVGATIAALKGLAKPTILILGGEGKGQDFSALAPVVASFARRTLLIGRDAALIATALAGLPTERCRSLEHAVERAAACAQAGEVVLLSPACASFDMFRDYNHRGEAFAAAVRKLST